MDEAVVRIIMQGGGVTNTQSTQTGMSNASGSKLSTSTVQPVSLVTDQFRRISGPLACLPDMSRVVSNIADSITNIRNKQLSQSTNTISYKPQLDTIVSNASAMTALLTNIFLATRTIERYLAPVGGTGVAVYGGKSYFTPAHTLGMMGSGSDPQDMIRKRYPNTQSLDNGEWWQFKRERRALSRALYGPGEESGGIEMTDERLPPELIGAADPSLDYGRGLGGRSMLVKRQSKSGSSTPGGSSADTEVVEATYKTRDAIVGAIYNTRDAVVEAIKDGPTERSLPTSAMGADAMAALAMYGGPTAIDPWAGAPSLGAADLVKPHWATQPDEGEIIPGGGPAALVKPHWAIQPDEGEIIPGDGPTAISPMLTKERTRLGQFTGKVVEIYGPPEPPDRANTGMAEGGLVTGPGGTDNILAMLTSGEVVIPAHMVKAGAIDHLRGKLPGFASGGVVAAPQYIDVPRAISSVSGFAGNPSSDTGSSVVRLGDMISSVNIVLGKFATTLGGATSSVGSFMRTLDPATDRYGEYSPQIAQAQGLAEIKLVMGDMRRSQEVGDQMAEYIMAKADLQNKFEDIKIKLLSQIVPGLTRILEIIEMILPSGEAIGEAVNGVAAPLNAIADGVAEWMGLNREGRIPAVNDPTSVLFDEGANQMWAPLGEGSINPVTQRRHG